MVKIFKKLFTNRTWAIAIKSRHSFVEQSLIDYNFAFAPIKNTKKFWFADPLLFEYEDRNYLFVEAFNKKEQKGEIGVFSIENGLPHNFKIIISEKYHLSYPCVFFCDGSFYMIPESAENNSVDLYVSRFFPYKWEKVGSLIVGVKYADPTVFVKNGCLKMMAYLEENGHYELVFYSININKCSAVEETRIQYDKNQGRPAGHVFLTGSSLLRPVQDSVEMYGKSIIFKAIDIVNNYRESNVCNVENKRIKIGHHQGVDRIHTFSCTSILEAIDYCYAKFDLFWAFKKMRRKKSVEKRKREREKGFN